jgi:hypothetical protein
MDEFARHGQLEPKIGQQALELKFPSYGGRRMMATLQRRTPSRAT